MPSSFLHNIIPAPCFYEDSGDWFEFNIHTRILVSHPELVRLAVYFKGLISPASGLDLQISSITSKDYTNTLLLILDDTAESDDGYKINIKSERICLSARHERGIFAGLQTLRQLLPVSVEQKQLDAGTTWRIPTAKIADQPRFKYRGMHLDVSRHFFSVEYIKKFIDLLAMYKMNYFHWHLVDDQGWRIEIKKHPQLTNIASQRDATVIGHELDRGTDVDSHAHGGFYTQEQISEIIQYAERRFITVIPEIDIPGHSSALLAAYPQYTCLNTEDSFSVEAHFGIFRNVLCNRQSSFDFLHDIFSEIATLFPSDYIHIGGDEVKKHHWQNCPDCQTVLTENNLSDYKQLQGHFIGRVVEIINSLGKQVMAWDDILESSNISSDITIMSWLGNDSAQRAIDNNNKLIMTQSNLYFDQYQSLSADEPLSIHGHAPLRDVYNYQPKQASLNNTRDLILGAQANLWSEYISSESKADYMLMPRLTALAEMTWSGDDVRDWDSYKQRLEDHFIRFDILGINASRSHYVPIIETHLNDDASFTITMQAENSNHHIHYTLDGLRPTQDSAQYCEPLNVKCKNFIRAICIDPITGSRYGVNQVKLSPHLAVGKKVSLITKGTEGKAPLGTNLEILTNGIVRQQQVFQHDQWASFENLTEFELVLDLESPILANHIMLGFDGCLGRKLYYPTGIEVFGSNEPCSGQDNSQRHKQGSCKQPIDQVTSNNRVCIELEGIACRFLHIHISNQQKIYSHEDKQLQTPIIYIDEIVVN